MSSISEGSNVTLSCAVSFSFNLDKYLLPICPRSINLLRMSFVEQRQTALLNVKLFLRLCSHPDLVKSPRSS